MPAVGAHYEFGQITLLHLTLEQREIIDENKEMFDLGLQGPDILFFYKPYVKNPISRIGHQIHSTQASMFFSEMFFYDDVVENRKKLAYLFGFICHYCLDKNCHPYIKSIIKNQKEHRIIEAELDSFIIDLYNLPKTRYQYVPDNNIDITLLSEIFSMIGIGDIKKSIRDMRKYIKLLDKIENIMMLEKILSLNGTFSSMCLMQDKRYEEETKNLAKIFHESIKEAKELIDEFYELSKGNISTLTKFSNNYEGA